MQRSAMASVPSATNFRGGMQFTVPDWSRITLSGHELGEARPFNCVFIARLFGRRHAFTATEAGVVELHASYMGGAVERRPYQEASVLVTRDANDEESMAAWCGPWNSLLLFRTGPAPAFESFLQVFDAFRIADTPEGLQLSPRFARQVEFEAFRVFREIPGIGDLRIQRPAQSEVVLPAWAGARSRTGEIWKQSFSPGGEIGRARPEMLVLATATAVTQLIPGPYDDDDSSVALAFLAELDVEWSSAA